MQTTERNRNKKISVRKKQDKGLKYFQELQRLYKWTANFALDKFPWINFVKILFD